MIALQATHSEKTKAATYKDLLAYQPLFRDTYASWRTNAIVYDAHNLWIAGIVELASYLSYDWPRYRTILERHMWELKTRMKLLEEAKSKRQARLQFR